MNVGKVDKQSIAEATAEAEAKPTAFNPDERIAYIRSNVTKIQADMALGSELNQLTAHYSEFAIAYPELFKKVVKKEDLGPLIAMMGALQKMGEGSLSQHQASVIVGQTLVDKFVKPQLSGSAPDKGGH